MANIPDRVVTSIQDKLRPLSALCPDHCIYRVPENLRQVNENAYWPLVVLIGRFYHNDPKLQPMQQHKLRYLQSFLQRNHAYNMAHYVQFIRQQQNVCNYYAEQINLDDDAFIEMVFFDAAFIIELFLQRYFRRSVPTSDRVCVINDWIILLVIFDHRLVENQLPFFILNAIYNLVFPQSFQSLVPFIRLTYKILTVGVDPIPKNIASTNIKHFVDFLRVYHLRSTPIRENLSNNQTFVICPTVTKLSEAGVKFKASMSNSLLDIRFNTSKGVLNIPTLRVLDDTEALFRNNMVFEQCHLHFDSYFIDYFIFLDGLIDTPKDVEILVQNGIIDNCLGSNEDVVNLFNNINKQIQFRPANFYYLRVCIDLKAYEKNSWYKWKVILKYKYFNHPWAAISVFYAILMLILAVLQVITDFAK